MAVKAEQSRHVETQDIEPTVYREGEIPVLLESVGPKWGNKARNLINEWLWTRKQELASAFGLQISSIAYVQLLYEDEDRQSVLDKIIDLPPNRDEVILKDLAAVKTDTTLLIVKSDTTTNDHTIRQVAFEVENMHELVCQLLEIPRKPIVGAVNLFPKMFALGSMWFSLSLPELFNTDQLSPQRGIVQNGKAGSVAHEITHVYINTTPMTTAPLIDAWVSMHIGSYLYREAKQNGKNTYEEYQQLWEGVTDFLEQKGIPNPFQKAEAIIQEYADRIHAAPDIAAFRRDFQNDIIEYVKLAKWIRFYNEAIATLIEHIILGQSHELVPLAKMCALKNAPSIFAGELTYSKFIAAMKHFKPDAIHYALMPSVFFVLHSRGYEVTIKKLMEATNEMRERRVNYELSHFLEFLGIDPDKFSRHWQSLISQA